MREAARELGVTPSAVSHQINALEEWLGIPLFQRGVRQIRLTETGRGLSKAVNRGFDGIATALFKAKAQSDLILKVSALPLITNIWLIPRLKHFELANPGVSIAIETSNRVVDLERDGIDIAIRNVRTLGRGLVSRKLLDLRALPICSRQMAKNVRSPADLAKVTLIHISSRPEGWDEWLAAAGMSRLKANSSLTFDTVPAAMEAAARGHGVMLGLDPLVWDAPASAELVAPFEGPAQNAGAYYVVHKRVDSSRRLVKAFVEWISVEMKSDHRRLMRLAREANRRK